MLKRILPFGLYLVAHLKSLHSTQWAYVTRIGKEDLPSLYRSFKKNSFHANNNNTKF